MQRQLKQSKFSLLNPKPTQISFVKSQGFTLPNRSSHWDFPQHISSNYDKIYTHTQGDRDLGKKNCENLSDPLERTSHHQTHKYYPYF